MIPKQLLVASAVLAVAVLMFAVVPAVEAEGEEAYTEVEDRDSLINALDLGAKIKLIDNITVDSMISIDSAVINLNDKTLSGASAVFEVKGTLTLEGNGKITVYKDKYAIVVDSDKETGLHIKGTLTATDCLGIMVVKSQVSIYENCRLYSHIVFSAMDQSLVIMYNAGYIGVVNYEGNEIGLGGKDGYEPKTENCILSEVDSSRITSKSGSLELSGKFKGSDNNQNRFINVTKGSVTTDQTFMGFSCVALSIGKDATLTINKPGDSTTLSRIDSVSKVTVEGVLVGETGSSFLIEGDMEIKKGGSVRIKGYYSNRGSIDSFGTIYIEEQGIITNQSRITIEQDSKLDVSGEFKSTRIESHDSITINRGELNNSGKISIDGNTVLNVSSGKFANTGMLTVVGKIIGSKDNHLANSSRLILDGVATDLHVDNADDASVKIVNLSGNLTVVNASDGYTRTIVCADHFQVGGLTIKSIRIGNGTANDLSGTVAVTQKADFKDEDDFLAHRIIKALGNATVKDELRLEEKVTFQSGDEDEQPSSLVVFGTLYTVCNSFDVDTVAGKIQDYNYNYLENSELTVTGCYYGYGNSFYINKEARMNYAKFETDTGFVITTLKKAIDSPMQKSMIWLFGRTIVDEDITVPEGIQLCVSDSIIIEADSRLIVDGKLLLANTYYVKLDGTRDDIWGELVLSRSSNLVLNGTLFRTMIDSDDYLRIYIFDGTTKSLFTVPGAYYSITDEEGNETVYVSSLSQAVGEFLVIDGNRIDLRGAEPFIIPEDEELVVPSGCHIHVSSGVRLVVGGDLTATVAGSKITSDGSIEVTGAGTIMTIEKLDEIVNTVMYTTEEGPATVYNYVSPDSVISGGDIDYEINGDVTIKTPIEGGLKFNGKNGSTVIIDASIEAGSLTLVNITLTIVPGKKVSATFEDGTGSRIEIDGMSGDGFTIISNGGSMEIGGKLQDGSECTVSSGIVANSVTIPNLRVESQGRIEFKGHSIVAELSLEGIAIIENGADLESISISIFGTLISSGDVIADRILIGVLESIIASPLTLGSDPVVSGSVTAREYMVVGAGSDVSDVTALRDYRVTSYFTEGIEYVTVYAAQSSNTKIGIISYCTPNAEWNGWYADNRTSVDVSGSNVGDHSVVDAIIDYDIYSIAIATDKAVSKVFIDGALMTKDMDGTWSASVAAGSHEITYHLKDGYTGTGILSLQSGGSGISVDDRCFIVGGDRGDFILNLAGFSWVGIPSEPNPPVPGPAPAPVITIEKSEGVSIANCLLVVLVGLVAIMAIVLAGRMLKR